MSQVTQKGELLSLNKLRDVTPAKRTPEMHRLLKAHDLRAKAADHARAGDLISAMVEFLQSAVLDDCCPSVYDSAWPGDLTTHFASLYPADFKAKKTELEDGKVRLQVSLPSAALIPTLPQAGMSLTDVFGYTLGAHLCEVKAEYVTAANVLTSVISYVQYNRPEVEAHFQQWGKQHKNKAAAAAAGDGKDSKDGKDGKDGKDAKEKDGKEKDGTKEPAVDGATATKDADGKTEPKKEADGTKKEDESKVGRAGRRALPFTLPDFERMLHRRRFFNNCAALPSRSHPLSTEQRQQHTWMLRTDAEYDVKVAPQSPYAWLNYGEAAMLDGNSSDACRAFRKAIEFAASTNGTDAGVLGLPAPAKTEATAGAPKKEEKKKKSKTAAAAGDGEKSEYPPFTSYPAFLSLCTAIITGGEGPRVKREELQKMLTEAQASHRHRIWPYSVACQHKGHMLRQEIQSCEKMKQHYIHSKKLQFPSDALASRDAQLKADLVANPPAKGTHGTGIPPLSQPLAAALAAAKAARAVAQQSGVSLTAPVSPPPPTSPPPSAGQCSACRKTPDTKLLACGGCKQRFYCSKECQKTDWKTHKLECKKIAAAAGGGTGAPAAPAADGATAAATAAGGEEEPKKTEDGGKRQKGGKKSGKKRA